MAAERDLSRIKLFDLASIYINTSEHTAGNPFDDAVVTLKTYREMFKCKYAADVYDVEIPGL